MKILKAAIEAVESARSAAMATVVGTSGSAPREAGARMLVYADGSIEGTVGGGAVEHEVVRQALAAIQVGAPRLYSPSLSRDLGMGCGGTMDIFIEPLVRAPRLAIFGAGHVSQATAAIAISLGFEVTVFDERPQFATAERFPGCSLVHAAPDQSARQLRTDDQDYLLLVTHKHAHDELLLELLLDRPWAWLGLIGSRRKVASTFARLREKGADEAQLKRVSSPVGLDIGAQTPAEIAVSICAEIVRVRQACQRPPLPLKEVRRS